MRYHVESPYPSIAGFYININDGDQYVEDAATGRIWNLDQVVLSGMAALMEEEGEE